MRVCSSIQLEIILDGIKSYSSRIHIYMCIHGAELEEKKL